jgi:hypothetical protein
VLTSGFTNVSQNYVSYHPSDVLAWLEIFPSVGLDKVGEGRLVILASFEVFIQFQGFFEVSWKLFESLLALR